MDQCVQVGSHDRLLAVDTRRCENAVWLLQQPGTEWEKLSDVSDGHSWYAVCFCRVPDGIIAVGGHCGTASSQCKHFSVATRQWQKLPDMPTARYFASAAMLAGNSLITVGGWDSDDEASNVCERLNILRDEWSAAAPMPRPMGQPLTASASGCVFILPREDEVTPNTRLVQYNPFEDAYTERARLPDYVHGTQGACLVAVKDKLCLLGCDQGMTVQYDPATDQWLELAKPTAFYKPVFACGAAVSTGNVMLCGGSSIITDDDDLDSDEEDIDAPMIEGGDTPIAAPIDVMAVITDRDERNMIEEYNTQTQQWTVLDIHLPFKYNKTLSYIANFDA